MKAFLSGRGMTGILTGVVVAVVLLLLFIGVFHSKIGNSNWLVSFFEKTVQKTQLIQSMRIDLLASAEAEKSAVMADTDEASQAFAEQSMQASAAVEVARRELGRLLEGSKSSREIGLFHDFSDSWEKLQETDREVLPLAVQNTNLKALRLSFVPAGEAIKRMEAALNRLMDDSASSPDAVKITRLAAKALTSALNIYTLQAPHIAETSDAKMDEIEAAMKGFDEQANDALRSLSALVDERGRLSVDEARASYTDFQKINAEVISLSRRNSNIRSFALSLGQKRKMMAQCLDLLAALQEAVQGTKFRATR